MIDASVRFDGAVGAVSRLSELGARGSAIELAGVHTVEGQTYATPVTASGEFVTDGGAVTFDDSVDTRRGRFRGHDRWGRVPYGGRRDI